MRTIIRSRHIFDGTGAQPFKGYLEYRGPFVTRVEHGWDYGPEGSGTQVIRHDDHLVMPGLHDNHMFFSGWMAANAGLDLSGAADMEQAVQLIAVHLTNHPGKPVYAHGWNREAWGESPDRQSLDGLSASVPITAIDSARSRYWMNTVAVGRYGFNETQLAAEDRARLIHEMCGDRTVVREAWSRFQDLLLSRGVVSCKDIVFDDCDVHRFLTDKLIDVTMYIEAVRHRFDTTMIPRYRYQSFGCRTRFGGVKIMVDGVVADSTGHICGRYANGSATPHVDYDAIEAEVAFFSAHGISCCLTAEGDKAIDKSAQILARHMGGQVRHSISDLEMLTNHAARIMADSGIVAEIYPQILGLNPSWADSYMPKAIAGHDGSGFFHYTHLTDCGVITTSGTDCPLFVASVPESLLRASRRAFDHGDRTWFPQYAMSPMQLLRSWIRGGSSLPAKSPSGVNSVGFLPGAGPGRILRRGSAATLVVFDRDLICANNDELRDARVLQTYIDGDLVYEA
jgi:predicted amidohydrolase YtcJ